MKILLLMRHAKSDWDADYDADHERPLSERGVRSARLMGRLVAGLDLVPGHVLCSTAIRARTTVELAAAAGNWNCPIGLDEGLYGSGPGTVLSIAARGPAVDRLMLVGHQPTWSMVLHGLTGARAEMKTASLAVVNLMIEDWSELEEAEGVLGSLHHARPYFGSQWDS